jgi:hypothetical protein
MGRRTWTTLAEERLRSWYGVKPTRELAAELGVSETALWAKAGRMGLTAASYGTSGDWFPDELETLRETYPLLGNACAPLCGHSPRQVSSRACYERLHRITKRHRVPRNALRRKSALMVARWCVRHGVGARKTLDACAEMAGCTPAMMRMVLPRLLKDEMRRKKKEDGNEQD